VAVTLGVAVFGTLVLVGVTVLVAVEDGVAVGVAVLVGVDVGVTVGVSVGVNVGVGVGEPPRGLNPAKMSVRSPLGSLATRFDASD